MRTAPTRGSPLRIRLRSGLARPALMSLVVLAFAVLAAVPAQAQTVGTLVSNADYAVLSTSSRFLAQSFTTGPGLASREVTAIELYIGLFPNPNPTVRIRENSSDDEPGALVATLINPASFTVGALNSFTAPSGTVLDEETTYWITLNEGADVSSIVRFGTVGTDDESGEVGWG